MRVELQILLQFFTLENLSGKSYIAPFYICKT